MKYSWEDNIVNMFFDEKTRSVFRWNSWWENFEVHEHIHPDIHIKRDICYVVDHKITSILHSVSINFPRRWRETVSHNFRSTGRAKWSYNKIEEFLEITQFRHDRPAWCHVTELVMYRGTMHILPKSSFRNVGYTELSHVESNFVSWFTQRYLHLWSLWRLSEWNGFKSRATLGYVWIKHCNTKDISVRCQISHERINWDKITIRQERISWS